ncbi:MAG: exo-beta-N-acetylmuramidase NamZ domain-containing protein, partial [bacterium]
MQGNRSGTCRFIAAVVLALLLAVTLGGSALGASPRVKLGNEVLLEKFRPLVAGKRVGLVTNQTGVNGRGESLIDILYHAGDINLVALYGPEHGIDGRAKAGEYVASYTHPRLKIPVYSLYGATRMPTPEMLAGIDVLVFDIQDIGARSYTYMSTLNYCLVAAQREGLPVLVLDRPNPLGG